MKPETTQIMIGGHLETVPLGYTQAESKFTEGESQIFYALPDGPEKEQARIVVLTKRIEFYELYMAGKVTIEKPVVITKTWRSYVRWLLGGKWPD